MIKTYQQVKTMKRWLSETKVSLHTGNDGTFSRRDPIKQFKKKILIWENSRIWSYVKN